jgi:hypothetical protein
MSEPIRWPSPEKAPRHTQPGQVRFGILGGGEDRTYRPGEAGRRRV